ncbi:MAG: SPASM domain-containing protein [Myxococcota bacterium]
MDRPACAGLWKTPMVQVDGDLTTCCLDERLENKLGNVRDTPLGDLWNGPVVHAWRVAQAEGRFSDSGPYCTRCNWRSAGAMSADELRAWAERTGETRLLHRLRNPA